MSYFSSVDQWFEGRTAIVTGGSAGLGRAIALAFSAAGSRVIVTDIADAGGEETVALIRSAGGEAKFVHADVSKSADVQAMVSACVDTYGGLDFAVNAAAIEFEVDFLADLPDDQWDRMLDVNLKSVFLCMKYEIRAMLAAGNGGAIVNIASTSSYRPQPHK